MTDLSFYSTSAPILEQPFLFFDTYRSESSLVESISGPRILGVILNATDLVPPLEEIPSSASTGLASGLIIPELKHSKHYPCLFLGTRFSPSS